jgi:dihydroneopterin aldolase
VKQSIEVNGIQVYAFHGCLPEEERIGGNYEVDVMLNTDFSQAALHDTLNQTIDYVDVNKIVVEEMTVRSKLIEHVGQRILNRLITELSDITYAKVRVIKISPPINGNVKNVAITIEQHI